MKKLLLLLFLLLTYNLNAQQIAKTEQVTNHSIHIVGDNFEGIVFNEDSYSQFLGLDSNSIKNVKIFTPTDAEITLAESILHAQIKRIDKNHKYRNGLDIYRHWRKYRHQYIFYITRNGERYLYVNCFSIDDDENWAKKSTFLGQESTVPRWYDHLIMAFDGGDSYWRVKINLQIKKIIEFRINGSPV